eukprot:RCo042082
MARPMYSFVPIFSVESLFDWKARRKIGDGAVSVVYQATCISSHTFRGFQGIHSGTSYAVKAILKDDEGMASRVHREVGIMKSLDSEYFVRLYFAFQDSSTVFLVEELFEGKELFDVVVEKRHLSEQIAANVTRQL